MINLNINGKIKKSFELPTIQVLSSQGNQMKIKSVDIKGIGGIKDLELNFIDGVNVICGANGIGKSTILDVISDAFGGNIPTKLKRNVLSETGQYKIKIERELNNEIIVDSKEETVNNFQPISDDYHSYWMEYSNMLLNFGLDRNFNYLKLGAITSDPDRQAYVSGQMAIEGINASDIKNWFVNRYLFSGKPDSLSAELMENYNLAQKAFGILDETVQFKTVMARSYDIMLSTNKGDIYFEYLSSGYKSCIYIIFGIIKEIEYRFIENPVSANNFNGIILIDEIDLHLHPMWQAELVNTLKAIFPKAQFILTTHSPSLLQTLEKDEIIALESNKDGETVLKNLQLGEYGLQGWTLEEILKDVMGMPTTTSNLYRCTIDKFDEALDSENVDDIKKYYDLLKKMLHPNSVTRRLLKIQMAEWEE